MCPMVEMAETALEECTLRPIQCELNIISRSDGSAILLLGETTVLSAVNGPIEVKASKICIDKASIEVVYRPKCGLSNVADRVRETIIRNICETAILSNLYPRTAISIVIQEMQDSGGLLACAVNSTCMALMHSGLAMKHLVAAVNCMIDNKDNIILDPSERELKECKGVLTFVFDNQEKSVLASHTEGRFTQAQFQECLLKCRLASDKIFNFYRDIVNKYANRI